MGIDFSAKPKNHKGDGFKFKETPESEPYDLSLGDICVLALASQVGLDAGEDRDPKGYKKKLARHALALKIAEAEKAGAPLELDSDQTEQLKERVGSFWSNAMMVGAAVMLLDPVTKTT